MVARDQPAAPTVLQFPEPPGRKIRRRIWVGVAVVLVLVAGAIGVLVFSPLLAVKTISVQGTGLVPAGKIDELLAPLAGKPLPQIAESDVRSLLAGVPAVADVKVEARPPSELAVRITERVPVALLKAGKRYALVDEEGRQLASVKSRQAAKLPLINAAKAKKDPDVFRTITAVLGALPPKVLARLDHASANSVDSVQLQLKDGTSVLWGNAEQRELKAKVLEALLKADPEVPVQVFDVSTPTRPVTR
ncbi:cell division protein FtsQ/DivIB [Arthrobacter sp. I2-34]|uniref:Cell division protein FtsQ/DivIB n=1 Tax=Arthrobacter hankyongi TaxID=2904801 RepID=A0ABS9LB20_9MICC|nr:cell division protein FtsQ/DivIB [Arthrobacter hankyongi]MCG2623855.1 cell division protein FtsQ/DivIB [Arthrobacter hankyongi]